MDTNYELYKIFHHVAVMLNFSEAFKQFFISQSVVNQLIKVLEKRLNQSLFIQSIKKVQLTSEGKTLLKHVEPATNLIKEGEDQLPETHTPSGGRLRIGASDTIRRYYLVSYLNCFHKEFLNIHVKIINQTSTECIRFLKNRQTDFIITNYPNSTLVGSTDTRVINEFHNMFVVSRNAFPLKGSRMSLEELLCYPITVLDHKSTTSESPHQVFQGSQLGLVPEIELSNNDLLIDLVRIGLGIVFVPDLYTSKNGEELFILDLKEQLPPRQMMMTYSKSLPVFQAARQFMDMLQETDV